MDKEKIADSVAVSSTKLLSLLDDRAAIEEALNLSNFSDIDAGNLARIAVRYLKNNRYLHELREVTQMTLNSERSLADKQITENV